MTSTPLLQPQLLRLSYKYRQQLKYFLLANSICLYSAFTTKASSIFRCLSLFVKAHISFWKYQIYIYNLTK